MQDSLKNDHYLVKKLRRKVNFSLFSFIVIFFVPYLSPKYRPFDTILNTEIGDFFPGIITTQTLFMRLPVFMIVLVVVFGYILKILMQLQKLDITDEKNIEALKKTHGRFDLLAFMVHVMAIYVVINTFFFSFASVDGQSMAPTFSHGDDVIMTHFSKNYDHGDIVVIEVNGGVGREVFYVKRLIGLPGDTISISNGFVSRNNQLLDEPYLGFGTRTECANEATSCEWTLEDNEYFVLGDNRERSEDSRHIGVFSRDRLYGNVRFRIRPLTAFGSVE